jgi:hypothetical protein
MKKISIMLIILFSLFATNLQAVPIQWSSVDGGNGHYYEVIHASEAILWLDANQAAESQIFDGVHGYLATITSAEENTFIEQNLLPSCSEASFWLGGYQDISAPDYSEPAGGWRWVTDEPWNFTNWSPGEPTNSNSQTTEEVLLINKNDAKWNDGGVTIPDMAYVVEYTPEPATLLLLGFGSLVLLRKRKK